MIIYFLKIKNYKSGFYRKIFCYLFLFWYNIFMNKKNDEKIVASFEQSFKNIDDILHKDAGCGSELDYVEQTSWVLFLKYLDDLEKDKETAALLSGEEYMRIIEPKFRWTTWAAPKLEDGKIDHNALTGDDLLDFVNGELFPYLKKFKENATVPTPLNIKLAKYLANSKTEYKAVTTYVK